MREIPEKASRSAAEVIQRHYAGGMELALRAGRDALAAALPHLGEPVVKPLEWARSGSGWQAPSMVGPYLVIDRQWRLPGGDWFSCLSDEAAKEAAQADYEQRIRSALYAAPHPAPATLGEVMADAKARFATLTPEQQEAEMRAQRESWARGEAAMGSDADEAREREAYRAKKTVTELKQFLHERGWLLMESVVNDLEAALAAANARAEKAERERDEATRLVAKLSTALTGLTPGGSEYLSYSKVLDMYYADREACIRVIRDRFDAGHLAKIELVDFRRRAEAAEARLAAADPVSDPRVWAVVEALEPFAHRADAFEKVDRAYSDEEWTPELLNDFRRARAALRALPNQSEAK